MGEHVSVVVLVGPSGAGKSTLQDAVAARHPDRVLRAVSHTTRAPREGEVDGREYNFVDRAVFEALANAGAFVETAEYSGNQYGSGATARQAAQQGKVCLQVLEPKGAESFRRLRDELGCRFVFVTAPREELVKRIRAERPDADVRVDDLDVMLRYGDEAEFDLVLSNSNLAAAVDELSRFVLGMPARSDQA